MKKRIAATFALTFAVGSVFAQTAPPATVTPQEQELIRQGTSTMAQQLDDTIEQFMLSGLDDKELQGLREIQASLGKLSENEMKQVVVLLKEYASGKRADALGEAHLTQIEIGDELRQVIRSYRQRQKNEDLAETFRKLSEEQMLLTGVNERYQATRQKSEDAVKTDEFKKRLEKQIEVQNKLRGDTEAALKKLEQTANLQQGRVGEANKFAKGKPVLDWQNQSMQQMRSTQFADAQNQQTQSVEALRVISEMLQPQSPPPNLAASIERILAEQQKVTADTTKATTKESAVGLQQLQRSLAAQTTAAGEQATEQTESGRYLAEAAKSMEAAAGRLGSEKPSEHAKGAQRDAEEVLKKALAALKKEEALAAAEAEKQRQEQEALQQASQQIDEAIKRQQVADDATKMAQAKPDAAKPEATKTEPPKPPEPAAQAEAPKPADAQAAAKPEQGQQANEPKANEPQAAAQQAAAPKPEAADQSKGEAAKPEAGQAQAEAAKPEAGKGQAEAAKPEAGQAQAEASKPEAGGQDAKQQAAQGAQAAAQEQAKAAEGAAGKAGSAEAAKALGDAQKSQQAAGDALKGGPDQQGAAAAAQKQAMSDLMAAKKAVDAKMNGGPSDMAAQDAANTAAAVAQLNQNLKWAADDVAAAQAALARNEANGNSEAEKKLAAAVKDLEGAQDAAKDAGIPSGGPMNAAKTAAGKGQGEARGNQNGPAKASADAAAQAIAAAQAAADAAVAAMGPPGQQPGKGPPGQTAVATEGSRPSGVNSVAAGDMGNSLLLKLPQREREALQQAQREPLPQAYQHQIEEYLKRLAEPEKQQ